MYDILETDTFEEIYDSLDNTEKQWIDKIKKQLAISARGKPLGFPWFREKKLLNKRLYFIVDQANKKVILLSFAPKKDQQAIIDYVKSNMKTFLDH